MAVAIEDLFIPEPEPREVKYTIVSVDDHVVEPADTFEGRMPRKMVEEHGPRLVEDGEGNQRWFFEGELLHMTGPGTTAGLKPGYDGFEPSRFEQMRRSWYDSDARVADMDINGVWASLCFATTLPGFANRVFSKAKHPEVGLAATKAWNDWIHEQWYGPNPDRLIPMGLTFLTDPHEAAAEIRRNAERGFRAVSLPERPHRLGLPDIFDADHWDPIVEACVDTGTVICLHIGSSGMFEGPRPDSPLHLIATMFGQLSMAACAEWLWSGIPERFPDVKISMSEGGIGWVPMLLDRLDNIIDRSGYGTDHTFKDTRPADVVQRNFWFCTLDDPSMIDTRHRIGLDHIMVEVDFPHADGTWPDSQHVIEHYWGHLPDDEIRRMCSLNAAKLFRWGLPDVVLPR